MSNQEHQLASLIISIIILIIVIILIIIVCYTYNSNNNNQPIIQRPQAAMYKKNNFATKECNDGQIACACTYGANKCWGHCINGQCNPNW